jgi:hypothetical protein
MLVFDQKYRLYGNGLWWEAPITQLIQIYLLEVSWIFYVVHFFIKNLQVLDTSIVENDSYARFTKSNSRMSMYF